MKTKERKEILLKDICPRLPYGLFVYDEKAMDKDVIYTYYYHPNIENVKPYLRPMSDMTEEEKAELKVLTCPEGTGTFDENGLIVPRVPFDDNIDYSFMAQILNFLNAKYLDYNGLIPIGLALPAPEGMY